MVFDQDLLGRPQLRQRAALLRVYNYYRILISFGFLFLFLKESFGEFVGAGGIQEVAGESPELRAVNIALVIHR